MVLVLISLKVFASNLSQPLFILKLATFLQQLEVLYLHKVYCVKLLLIILIYYVTFTDLILEKGFMKVKNVQILRLQQCGFQNMHMFNKVVISKLQVLKW